MGILRKLRNLTTTKKQKEKKLTEKETQRKALMEALENPANKIKTDGNFEEFRKSANEYLDKVISALDKIIEKRHFYSDSLPYFKGIKKNLTQLNNLYNYADLSYEPDLLNSLERAENNLRSYTAKLPKLLFSDISVLKGDLQSKLTALGKKLWMGSAILNCENIKRIIADFEKILTAPQADSAPPECSCYVVKEWQNGAATWIRSFYGVDRFNNKVAAISNGKPGFARFYKAYMFLSDLKNFLKDSTEDNCIAHLRGSTRLRFTQQINGILKNARERKFTCEHCGKTRPAVSFYAAYRCPCDETRLICADCAVSGTKGGSICPFCHTNLNSANSARLNDL